MASRGPTVLGTDGTDFMHRQRVASHYTTSVVNKSRLKFCIYMHYMLFCVMLLKLSQDILDRLDIFILELEELYIPKPRLWEWLWTSSILLTFVGLQAVKRNHLTLLKIYGILTLNLSLSPALYACVYYFRDMYNFIETRDLSKVSEVWQGYPVALIWYAFLVVALQVHSFQLYFAYQLYLAWSSKKTPAAKKRS